MDIQVNTDNRIEGTMALEQEVEERLRDRLTTRFGDRLTRIEVHVRDIDGENNRPDGVEATLEARPANGDPIKVSDRAGEPMQAVNAALGKLVTRFDSVFGKADRVRW